MDWYDLKDKLIVITGAGSGFGHDTTLALAKAGARVVAVSKHRTTPNCLGQSMEDFRGLDNVYPVYMDMSDPSVVQGLVWSVVKDHGKVNGLIHFAGTARLVPLRGEHIGEAQEMFNLHYFTSLAFLKSLIDKRRADKISIVLISSMSELLGFDGLTVYASAKGATRTLAMTAASEVRRMGGRINCILPGHVESAMTRSVRHVQSDDYYNDVSSLGMKTTVADVVDLSLFLLSDRSRFLNGRTVVIDGGLSHMMRAKDPTRPTSNF